MEKTIYRYPARLSSIGDVRDFVRIASKIPEDINITCGRHRLSAKSFLSVALAVISWEEIVVEASYDCYFDFERFIA